MNITDISAFRACTSCQMCGAVCAQDAIQIHLNEDGFYRPYIDSNKCTDCGSCTRICYKFDNEFKITNEEKLANLKVYAAQSLSDTLLEKVTSGGVADVLAKELVRQGYVCIGVTYDDNKHRAEHVLATTEIQTDAFRGSKYIQSYSYEAFKTLVKNVRTTKFAIFGLPCHIYAVNRYLTSRRLRDNCILIDLFCHGCPSMNIWTKYERRIKEQVNQRKFDEVMFRSKLKGWGNFYVIAVLENGRVLFSSNPKQDEFFTLFFSDLVLNDSCLDCKLRSTMEYTDIRLGDFWGKNYLSDTKGTSAVVVATERGGMIFEAIMGQFKTIRHHVSEVIDNQSYGKSYLINAELRKRMLASLSDKSVPIDEAVKIYYASLGFASRIKRAIKFVNWYMPFDIVRWLKRIK